MLAVAALLFVSPYNVFWIVLLILSLGLAIEGLRTIFYYFAMARFMVGGKMMLYKGIIVFDFAVLTASLADLPRNYVLMYLIGVHAFSGIVDVLRSMEAKRYGGKSWRLKLGQGLLNLVMCVLCLVFFKKPQTVIILYALGVAYSAVLRIISAFRKTALVYIQ